MLVVSIGENVVGIICTRKELNEERYIYIYLSAKFPPEAFLFFWAEGMERGRRLFRTMVQRQRREQAGLF